LSFGGSPVGLRAMAALLWLRYRGVKKLRRFLPVFCFAVAVSSPDGILSRSISERI
jgi:hypothetical protein